MKQVEFKTNRGKFAIIDSDIKPDGWYVDIRNITEEQADSIIRADFVYNANDGSDEGDIDVYQDFTDNGNFLYSAKESLFSLFESLGIYLFDNPISHPDNIEIQPASINWWIGQEENHLKAEEETFRNPYIIKI